MKQKNLVSNLRQTAVLVLGVFSLGIFSLNSMAQDLECGKTNFWGTRLTKIFVKVPSEPLDCILSGNLNNCPVKKITIQVYLDVYDRYIDITQNVSEQTHRFENEKLYKLANNYYIRDHGNDKYSVEDHSHTASFGKKVKVYPCFEK